LLYCKSEKNSNFLSLLAVVFYSTELDARNQFRWESPEMSGGRSIEYKLISRRVSIFIHEDSQTIALGLLRAYRDDVAEIMA
jgi:hypothetical protein